MQASTAAKQSLHLFVVWKVKAENSEERTLLWVQGDCPLSVLQQLLEYLCSISSTGTIYLFTYF